MKQTTVSKCWAKIVRSTLFLGQWLVLVWKYEVIGLWHLFRMIYARIKTFFSSRIPLSLKPEVVRSSLHTRELDYVPSHDKQRKPIAYWPGKCSNIGDKTLFDTGIQGVVDGSLFRANTLNEVTWCHEQELWVHAQQLVLLYHCVLPEILKWYTPFHVG